MRCRRVVVYLTLRTYRIVKPQKMFVYSRALQHRDRIAESVQHMATEIGTGIDVLTDNERKEVLKLVLERVGIDGEGNVKISLAIPEPEFLRFEQAISRAISKHRKCGAVGERKI